MRRLGWWLVWIVGIGATLGISSPPTLADDAPALPRVKDVSAQALRAQVVRVAQALEQMGAPLSGEHQQAFQRALECDDPEEFVALVQQALDPLCLVGVHINPQSRVKVAMGPAPRELIQQGWRVFLIKVHNEAGVTARLNCTSPNAEPLYARSSGAPQARTRIRPQEVEDRWLDVGLYDKQPLVPELSGLPLEYRTIELYSRDAGQREAKLLFDVGQGTQDLGFRNEVNILFNCLPAVEVVLEVLDDDGSPTTGWFVITDARGRVYPSRARRLAPDFFFHDQVYRHSGESVYLPPGSYQVAYGRGPEYLVLQREIQVPEAAQHKETFHLKRWIKVADFGWYSGDHHVHAAGCAHYEAPSEGVTPEDMLRHILGEDLNVGCVLSWGPCWYYQKQFFEGQTSALSQPTYLMRYDVEVSGFPSSHAGHLCLLRLSEDDYPGTSRIEEWPSWDLPILKWGKEQGGVVGFSHSGWGLEVPEETLPTYSMPPFNGIGANEYIVDVTHGVCDFISAVDTPIVWELNIWYHTLNCGYITRISGETDFPCIYGERVGLGRAYVKMTPGPDGRLNYDDYAFGLRDGRSYCSDGKAHLINFRANGLGVGEPGDGGRPSVLRVRAGEQLQVALQAAAYLEPEPREDIRQRPLRERPYWHVERARVENTRTVPVELIVNGQSVATRTIEADGRVVDVTFDYTPTQSSWIAVRIFPAAHTNPIFVEVDGKPIRASRRSAQWCLDAVDVCWKQKAPQIRESERAEAERAFEAARQAYRLILAECTED